MNIRPLSCELGHKPTGTFSRRIRQIGEVYYTPTYESEEIRHLKVFLLKSLETPQFGNNRAKPYGNFEPRP
jgi:hypothetical protein